MASGKTEAPTCLLVEDKRLSDMTDVELASVMNREISEYTAEISESAPHDSVSIEITPSQTDDTEKGITERQTNQNVITGEGKSTPNRNNHTDTLNIPTNSFATKSGSPSVVSAHQVNNDKDNDTDSSLNTSSKHLKLSPISCRSIEKTSILQNEDSWIAAAIPYLPIRVAVLCFLINIVFPGSGTIVSGFCILCCARPRVPPKYHQDFVLLLCTNTLVGLAQLFTVTFLLVGWFWSVAWGIRMLILSLEYKDILQEERTTRLKEQAVNAFKSIR